MTVVVDGKGGLGDAAAGGVCDADSGENIGLEVKNVEAAEIAEVTRFCFCFRSSCFCLMICFCC